MHPRVHQRAIWQQPKFLNGQWVDPGQVFPEELTGTAERMADAMFELNAETGSCTEQDLLDADFSAEEIATHGAEARRLATRRFVKAVDAEPYDRAARIERGANLVAGLIVDEVGPVYAVLRQSGFERIELADIFPEIVTRSAAIVASTSGDTQSPVAVGLGQSVSPIRGARQ